MPATQRQSERRLLFRSCNILFFTPRHLKSPGTPNDSNAEVPSLFTSLKIRSKSRPNRIVVAPICQYSTTDSGDQVDASTPYHITTLGYYALKGASLVFIEATGVQPNGRISPNCPGIWSNSQIPGVRAVADIVRRQDALCGIAITCLPLYEPHVTMHTN